jgi:hypothetical protein
MVVLSLALVACDSGGGNGGGENGDESFPEPPGRPGFTSTVTGAWQASLSGTAVHTAEGTTSGRASSVVIRLSGARADGPVITLVAENAVRPGVHPIRPAGTSGITARIQEAAGLQSWTGVSGTIQVDRIDGASIVGEFYVVADGAREESITASGAFATIAER